MRRVRAFALTLLAGALLAPVACGREDGTDVELTVPAGSTLQTIVDSLAAREVVSFPRLFGIYARLRGEDRRIQAGRYALRTGSPWSSVLGTLTRGEVIRTSLTIPEGFRLDEIAPRIAEISGVPSDSVLARLRNPEQVGRFDLPGPSLEGYLFPDTYLFSPGIPADEVIEAMVERWHAAWSPDRQVQADELGMTLGEVMTLASIVQAEARHVHEMPLISGVYHNRLRLGWLLQADPTVLYALGDSRQRLTFPAIDSIADNPYNTYRQGGLPPGPIGAPGEAAIDAALNPEGDFLYFVARADGTHTFTRSLDAHNRAVAEARREIRSSTRGGI